jgi:hypothetical protein
MRNGERLLKQAIEAIVAEAIADMPPAVAPVISVDGETKEQIAQYVLLAHKTYLTRKEVALYLNVSERSISEWTARPVDRNPFPESAAGDSPRYKREQVDAWAVREGQGRRLRLIG